MEQVLFSCVGTTDPIRGEHDGPMVHIMRNYRPSAVYVFITAEIRALDNKDARFKKTEQWIREHWDGYAPIFEYIDCPEGEAHDMDKLDAPIHEAMDRVSREHPNAEILINVTSGTPQMQMILSQLSMDIRYNAKGIQVANYERRSGTSDRTNKKEYDIDFELECNEDEEADAKNRCVEPQMYVVRREHMRHQITALLEQRNFDAVAEMDNAMPQELMTIVRHLAARNRLDGAEALRIANTVTTLPFRLYSYRMGDRTEYSKVSEYYLLMKNLVRAGHYTEFILHMEPLTLTLQLALLERKLKTLGASTDDILVTLYGTRRQLSPTQMQTKLPALYAYYEAQLAAEGRIPEQRDISFYACSTLLGYFKPLPQKAANLFDHYEKLKEQRNRLAHELTSVTDAEIKAACGADAAHLLAEMEATIIECYPACDPAVFSVYDKCISYIEARL